ncbi:MAG: adenosylcobinamide-GDP ribazoletransferase [Betaproteobacteria bacterium]
MVVKQLKNLLSFLTVLPVSMDNNLLTDCARNMWAFPLVGAFLGLLAGLFGWVALQFLPLLVVGALVLAVLLWLTGLHHTDGLLDFGDGIMVHGTAEHKIEVMHDQLTGAGAIGLSLMTYVVTAFAFASFGGNIIYWDFKISFIFPAIIVTELCAKLSMVVAARVGKSVHQGMNTSFLQYMHGSGGNTRLAAALTISLAIAFLLLSWAGIVTVLAAVAGALAMVAVAHKHFKGVTGDVFGATNELTRMLCAVVVLGVASWA